MLFNCNGEKLIVSRRKAKILAVNRKCLQPTETLINGTLHLQNDLRYFTILRLTNDVLCVNDLSCHSWVGLVIINISIFKNITRSRHHSRGFTQSVIHALIRWASSVSLNASNNPRVRSVLSSLLQTSDLINLEA